MNYKYRQMAMENLIPEMGLTKTDRIILSKVKQYMLANSMVASRSHLWRGVVDVDALSEIIFNYDALDNALICKVRRKDFIDHLWNTPQGYSSLVRQRMDEMFFGVSNNTYYLSLVILLGGYSLHIRDYYPKGYNRNSAANDSAAKYLMK